MAPPAIDDAAMMETLQRVLARAKSSATEDPTSSSDPGALSREMRLMAKSMRDFREGEKVAAQVASGAKNIVDADGNPVGEESDSAAGSDGAAAPQANPTPATPATAATSIGTKHAEIQTTDADCVMTLGRNMDKVPGFMKIEDAERLSQDTSLPSDLRAAFAHLHSHPELFNKMETADGSGGSDGTLSSGDMMAYARRPEFVEANREMGKAYVENYVPSDAANGDATPRKMTESDACRELYLYSDSLPENIMREDLQKIVDGQCGKKCPAQMQAAAQFMLDNPDSFSKLAPSGTVSRGELQDHAINQVHLSKPEMSALNTVQTNREVFLKDGFVTRESLSKLVEDPNASGEVKKAAKKLLESPVLFGMLDNAAAGHVASSAISANDGKIGSSDLDAIVQKLTDINKKPPPKPEAPASSDARMQATGGKGERSGSVEKQPDPAKEALKAKALASMAQGWSDDPAIKAVDVYKPPAPSGFLGFLQGALNVVGKVLDVAKTACDVAAGFLPPPLSGIVTAVGAGLATVNNMAVKAPKMILDGISADAAYAEAGKLQAMDLASSAMGLIPGAGVAKAGASIAKAAGVGAAREGGEVLLKEAGEAAVKEGVKEGVETSAKTGAKEGLEAGAKEGVGETAEVNTKQVLKDTTKDTTKEVASGHAQDELMTLAASQSSAAGQQQGAGQGTAPATDAAPAMSDIEASARASRGFISQMNAAAQQEIKEQEERNKEEQEEEEAAAAKKRKA